MKRFLLLAVLLFGCATSATIARQTIAGVDTLNGAAARVATVYIQQCTAAADALADAGNITAAKAKAQACHQAYDDLQKSLQVSQDTLTTVEAGVDVAESANQKDFSSILTPIFGAAEALVNALQTLGVKLPSSVTSLL